jgi:hypothetical protein
MKLSFRKHEMRSTLHQLGLIIVAVQALSPHALSAETGMKRYPVTSEMVVTAMQYRQLPTKGVEVRLAAPITAVSDNPMLEIQSVTQVSSHGAQLKVACRNRTQCLPFYASATWLEATEGSIPSTPARPAEQPQGSPQQTSSTPSNTARPGSHATLVIEEGKIHIRLQVVLLQGGSAGDKVRVSTADHKTIYKAEIVTPNLLKGSL